MVDGGPYQTFACPSGTSIVDTGLVNGTTYYYTVSAIFTGGRDKGGESADSVQVSATPQGPQGSTLTFTPTADATIKKGSPNKNFGSAKLSVKSPGVRFLIKFTVSGVGTRTVTGAKLRLWNVDPSNGGGDFHVSDTSWGENTVTWNTPPAYYSETVTSLGSVAQNAWAEADLSTVISGDGTYSFCVTSSSTDVASYTSKEGTSAHRPQLVLSLQ